MLNLEKKIKKYKIYFFCAILFNEIFLTFSLYMLSFPLIFIFLFYICILKICYDKTMKSYNDNISQEVMRKLLDE